MPSLPELWLREFLTLLLAALGIWDLHESYDQRTGIKISLGISAENLI